VVEVVVDEVEVLDVLEVVEVVDEVEVVEVVDEVELPLHSASLPLQQAARPPHASLFEQQ
jgi:hypothetical protein